MVIRPISIFFNLVLWFRRVLLIFRHFYCSQYGEKSNERRKLSVGNMLRWFVCGASIAVPLSNIKELLLPGGAAHKALEFLLPSHPSRNDKYLTSKSGKICWFFRKNRSKHKTKLKSISANCGLWSHPKTKLLLSKNSNMFSHTIYFDSCLERFLQNAAIRLSKISRRARNKCKLELCALLSEVHGQFCL